MSNRVFSDKLLETAVCDFLPSEVVFALGDKHKVECAARWINSLQAENKKLREELEKERVVVDFYADKAMWQYSAYNSAYKNWIKAHPSDQEQFEAGKWVGGKRARQRQKERK